MYGVSDLQITDWDDLPNVAGIEVVLDPEIDSMHLQRAQVIGPTREAVIEYVRENWGEEDPDWFRDYVVARVEELPPPPQRTVCLVDEVEARIAAALAEWDAGRAPSPDQRDYVIFADEVLRRLDPAYTAPAGDLTPFDAIADEMYEEMEAGGLPDVRAMAITARLYDIAVPRPTTDEILDAAADLIDARAPKRAAKRTILIHLNVALPATDPRTTEQIVAAVAGAIEVGSDDESLAGLDIAVLLAEEI